MSHFFCHPCLHWRPQFLIRLSSLPAGKSLPVPQPVPRTQIKGRVMSSKNPVAEETLGLRPWNTRTALRSRPPKQQRNRPSGANRRGAPVWTPPRASLPQYRAAEAMSSGTQESSRNAKGTALVPDNGQGMGSKCYLAQMSVLLPSLDEPYIQKMPDLVKPLACQELGNEREKRGRGGIPSGISTS
jgi:hypothetical protein